MSRSPDPHPLFRTEALEAQNDTFHGDVLIAHRPGVRLLVTCACAVAVALIAFAWWGQHNAQGARKRLSRADAGNDQGLYAAIRHRGRIAGRRRTVGEARRYP